MKDRKLDGILITMGLDDFSTGDSDDISSEDSVEDDWDTGDEEEGRFPSTEAIAGVIRHHSMKKDLGIEVDGQELKGDAEGFAKLFALMFIDYPDADPYSLEDPR